MNIGICKVCGKETNYKYKSYIKECCSHKCSNILKWRTREREKRKKIKCKICGKEFSVALSDHRFKEGIEIKYCSKKCNGIDKRTRKLVKCQYCGKEFETTRNQFCSKDCAYKYKVEHYKHKIYQENGYNVIFINGYNKKGNAKQHRVIMEKYICRKLRQDEIVHHINGIKNDNRIDNLKIMTVSEHNSYHRKLELANGKELFGR